MGGCISAHNEDYQTNKRIEKDLKRDEKQQKTEVKLLLLGKSQFKLMCFMVLGDRDKVVEYMLKSMQSYLILP